MSVIAMGIINLAVLSTLGSLLYALGLPVLAAFGIAWIVGLVVAVLVVLVATSDYL